MKKKKWHSKYEYCEKCGRTNFPHYADGLCKMCYTFPRTSISKQKGGKRKTRSYLIKEADKVFSQYIRQRDGKCLKCGSTNSLQCSHIIPREVMLLRFDEQNAITLCHACHIYWWHKNPLEASEWFNKEFEGIKDELIQIRNKAEKVTVDMLLEIIEKYKSMITTR